MPPIVVVKSHSVSLPVGIGASTPFANNAEITVSDCSWNISKSSIPSGTEIILLHLFGPGGNGSNGGGGGGGSCCIKTVYLEGGSMLRRST